MRDKTAGCFLYLIVCCFSSVRGNDWVWGGEVKASSSNTGGLIIPSGSVTNCTCVASARCNSADVISFGVGLIDPRARQCLSGEVCCTRPLPAVTTAAPLTGCGLPNALGALTTTQNRIVKPTQTVYGEFPWQAAILEKSSVGNKFLCGGTLISSLTVLTAAHCIDGKTASNLVVRLGEWDAASTQETYPFQELTVSKTLIHPDFYAAALFNDVGLVTLSSPADTTRPTIRYGCLPESLESYNLGDCVTIGWGKSNFDSPNFSAILTKTKASVIGHGDCQAKLQATRLGSQFRLHERFLCAGETTEGDSCVGDGGGPLMCPRTSQPERLIQVGIVSWGIGCGTSPGVYADLTQLAPWVKANMV